MTKLTFDCDVLIAGGGPVGVTLAMDLATRGVSSIVLEQRRDLPPNPRCNTTNARSMEVFRRLGCADAVRAAGLPGDNSTDVVYMTTMNGKEICRFERDTPDTVRAGAMKGIGHDWPTPEPPHYISQLYMEPALRHCAVTKHGVDLRLGWEIGLHTQNSDGVTSVARDVETGKEVALRSRYLVGADGSNSRVRRDIGARLEGIPMLGHACSVFLRSKRLTELYAKHPGWMYRFLGGVVMVAIDGTDEWLIHTNPAPGTDPEAFNPEPMMFAGIGEAFEYEIININRWTARAMVANKYREGRVFLAGDAAHIWIPMGGFGMNAGVGDAVSIGWLLAGEIKGWLDPRALDAYEMERTALGALVASQAARWGAELRPLMRQSPEQCAAITKNAATRAALGAQLREINGSEWENSGMQLGYRYAQSPIIMHDGTPPPDFSLSTYHETSWPGVRAPHIWREGSPAKAKTKAKSKAKPGAKRLALYDEFGTGFALLRIGANAPDAAAFVTAAKARKIPLVVLDVPEREAVKKYEGYGLVLVRPDQHIAWRAKTLPPDPGMILDHVTGRRIKIAAPSVYHSTPLKAAFGTPAGLDYKRNKLVVADTAGLRVAIYDPKHDTLEPGVTIDGPPSGVGHLPDGRLIVAAMKQRRLLVVEGGVPEDYTDLGAVATGDLGHMIVDRSGRIYVVDTGGRSRRGGTPTAGAIIAVEADGSARVVLAGLAGPTGMAISPDGNTFFVSETAHARVQQCRIHLNGDLKEARPYIELGAKRACDGMTIDRDGALWLCLPDSHAVERYDHRGRLSGRIDLSKATPRSCVLSSNEQTLFIAGIEAANGRGFVSRAELAAPAGQRPMPKVAVTGTKAG